MFKSVVCRSREHPVASPKLFDVPQPLELGRVDDLHHQWVELNVTVDGIIEYLHRIDFAYNLALL